MTTNTTDTNDATTDHSESNPDTWEPIEAEDYDDARRSTRDSNSSAMMRQRVAGWLDEKELQEENVQDVLAAVDALLKEEEDTASTGSSVDILDEEPKKVTRKKESRLKVRRRLKAARAKLKKSLVSPVASATRKMVTGSKSTRIRDFVVLPKVVRVLDKYTFTTAVLGMLVTEFVILEWPSWFRYYNVITMLPLLALRVVLFHRTKQQYFLLDYCYWVNGLAVCLAFLPFIDTTVQEETQQMLWQILFVSANGPLFFAMIAWNNSLVFHSVDKVTSTYVHLFPALLCWCERWQSPTSPIFDQSTRLSWSRHFGYPLLFYTLWQVVYLIQTEWWHKPVLDADPDLSTSLRYLTSAHKMSVNKFALKLTRRMGIMKADETFDPPTLKVKVIFVVLQMIMTICTFVPVGLFYWSKWVHTAVVISILAFSVYNGARYYIQVFSKIYERRYNDDGEEEEEYVDTSAVMSEHRDVDKKKS